VIQAASRANRTVRLAQSSGPGGNWADAIRASRPVIERSMISRISLAHPKWRLKNPACDSSSENFTRSWRSAARTSSRARRRQINGDSARAMPGPNAVMPSKSAENARRIEHKIEHIDEIARTKPISFLSGETERRWSVVKILVGLARTSQTGKLEGGLSPRDDP